MILALQSQQNAQAGYAADYQNKRSAQSFNEVREAKKAIMSWHKKSQIKELLFRS